MLERLHFEHAHGAIPEHRFAFSDSGSIGGLGFGADVETHHVRGHRVGRAGRGIRVFGEFIGNNHIGRKQHLHATLFSLLEHLARALDPILFFKRRANLVTLSKQEGEAHAATNDDGIGLVDKSVDNANLVGDLRAAQNGNERALGVVEHTAQSFHFASQQEARICGKQCGDAGRGCMSAVRGAERVVHIHIAQLSKHLAELGVVFLLTLVETEVFEHNDFAVGKRRDLRLGIIAHGIGGEGDRGIDELAQTRSSRRKRELILKALARRTAQVAHEHDLRAALHEIFDGRQRRTNARVVGHDAVFDGHVEIDAH